MKLVSRFIRALITHKNLVDIDEKIKESNEAYANGKPQTALKIALNVKGMEQDVADLVLENPLQCEDLGSN